MLRVMAQNTHKRETEASRPAVDRAALAARLEFERALRDGTAALCEGLAAGELERLAAGAIGEPNPYEY